MDFEIFDLGLVNFEKARHFQEVIFNEVKEGRLTSALIFCRHYPVITLGRQADSKNILMPQEELTAVGIPVYRIERGGDVTYHGPGQLLAYPVFNLNYFKKDIHYFLRRMEDTVIGCLSAFGVKCQRYAGLTGAWIGKKKVASIGIAIRRWITSYGLSINIKKGDLYNFRFIRPCGLDVEMTAVESVLGRDIEIGEIKENLARNFQGTFLSAGGRYG